MIDKDTILSAKKTPQGSSNLAQRTERMFSGGPDGHLSAPQYYNAPNKMAHLIKILTDLLLQLFNLFIIKSCWGVQGDVLPLNCNHFRLIYILTAWQESSYPMQAHFLFRSNATWTINTYMN